MDRVNCPACARSCAAQAKRCLGCGALLAQPVASAIAPPAETNSSGSVWRALVAIALLAGTVGFGWRQRTLEREKTAREAALAAEVAARPQPKVAAAPVPQPPVAAAAVSQPFNPVVPAATPPAAFAQRAPLEAAPPRPVLSLPTVPWSEGARGFRTASNEQRVSRRPMLLYFHTDWCPYCKQFDREILPDAEVAKAIAPAVKVRINPEKGADENEIARRYGVTGYPTLILVAEEGAAPVRLGTGVTRGTSPDTAQLVRSVRSNLKYAWDSRALASLNSGQPDEAIRYADLLLAFEPNDTNGRAHYLRALAFQKKGDLNEALRDYRAGCAEGCTSCCTATRF